MSSLGQAFSYRLEIDNRTSRDFVCVEQDLRWGRWHGDGVDNQLPVSVPAGRTVSAMGIWMPPDKTTGYECRCVWADNEDEKLRTGEIALTVSVPFLPGKNRAGLDVSGPYKIEGWTGIPRLGHEFSHVLTIREIVYY